MTATTVASFADAPAAENRYISIGDGPDPTAPAEDAQGSQRADPLAAEDHMNFSGLEASWDPTAQQAPPQSTSATPGDAGTDLNTTPWQGSDHSGSLGDQIVAYAMKFRGVPYRYGANGPTAFDCSGLTRYVYAHLGIDLPRISYQQANSGTRLALKDMKPGDLVAWDDSSRNPGADHIAIYVGNGEIIEAPRPGKNVRVRKLGGWDQDAHAWGVRIQGVNGG